MKCFVHLTKINDFDQKRRLTHRIQAPAQRGNILITFDNVKSLDQKFDCDFRNFGCILTKVDEKSEHSNFRKVCENLVCFLLRVTGKECENFLCI